MRNSLTIPIIVTDQDHGDIDFFESVELAERKLEAVDVRNEEYVAYDGEGRLLKLGVERREAPIFFGLEKTLADFVIIDGAEKEPAHASQLRAVLIGFLVKIDDMPEDLDMLPLRELVRRGINRAGFTV